MPKDQEFSDTSSSVESLLEEERRRRRKKKKKHRRDDDSDSDRHRRHRKSDKKRKKHKSSKRKKERKKHYDSESSHSSGDDESYDRRRRHKRSRKDRKRRRKDDNDDDERKSNRQQGVASEKRSEITRSQKLAKALHHLLLEKPEFASELPLILIRLAGGTTFDLRQVNDPAISIGLQSVFEALEPFGVQKQQIGGMWMFQNPPGATRRDELVLLRITRSLLDDVDVTMDNVKAFEEEKKNRKDEKPAKIPETDETTQPMKDLTFSILEKFRSKDATLGTQLASLCMTIVEGESVSVDGIPDEELKSALESLFQACGLERSEIEDDDDSEEEDDDEEEDDESPLMGYGLPSDGSDDVQLKLATIMAACREGPPKPKSIGPMRRPMTQEEQKAANAIYGANNADAESDEDDGPLLPGQARAAPAPSLATIQAQAEYRALELKSVEQGVPMPIAGEREEWMINPGQHDFLSGIKSGQAIKSRGFQNKKSRGEEKVAPVHPAVQAEMDAIMQAHENARGPSLMDLHQSQKTKEKALAAAASAANGGKKEFNWSRDKDLDAGRRVDKDALGMILGGAATELKSKFAGGFNR